MKIVYIKEQDENLNLKQRIKSHFNIIDIGYIDKKVFFTLPISEKTRKRRLIKVIKKLNQILYKDCIENVVLSKKLFNNELIKNKFYEKNINILDGKKLFAILSTNIIEKICELSELKMEEIEISVLVNESNEIIMDNILEISKFVKRLNIITNHINRFQRIQNYLYNELGIMIKISNNKKKDLLNSTIILNMDFPEELINSYNIPNKCIIVNINNENTIKKRQFNGINIINYNIYINEKYSFDKFSNEIMYESLIYENSNNEAKQRLLQDKVRNKKLDREKRRN